VVAMVLVVADAADDCLLDALGLEADQVEDFPHVALALRALGIVELFRHCDKILIIINRRLGIGSGDEQTFI
jgi:hypothetical protein